MDLEHYLSLFEIAAKQLDQKKLKELQLEVATGIVLNSAYLKLFKKSWSNMGENPLTAETRIFFSVWMNPEDANKQILRYNIHALKLRKLKGYHIESRKFAEEFRKEFKRIELSWPNVKLNYGPLTLIEGWIKIDIQDFKHDIIQLSNNFIKITFLIDETLLKFKL